jgi:hypothetical protein
MSRMVESLDVLRWQHMKKACAAYAARSVRRLRASPTHDARLAGESREIAARAAVSLLQSSRHG